LLEHGAQRVAAHAREVDQHRRPAAVVVRREEDIGIGLEKQVALVGIELDHQRLAVLAKPREERAPHPEGGRAVRRAIDDAGQRERELAHGGERETAGPGGTRLPGGHLAPVERPRAYAA
jgi:molybdate-binding protein